MKENLKDLNTALIKWITVGMVFITPLLFTPWTFDFFEFPKQVLVWSVSMILLILWLMRFVIEKEVKVVKTPVDLPLLLFISVGIISTILSASRYTSVVGFFGRPDGGLAAIVAYAIIFYVAASTFDRVSDVIHILVAFLSSCALLSVLAISYYLGQYILGWQPANVRSFSPVGSIFSLSVLLSMALPVALGLLVYLKKGTQTQPQAQPSGYGPTPANESTTNTKMANIAPLYGVLLTVATLLFAAVIVMVWDLPSIIGATAALAVFFLWSKRSHVKTAAPYILGVVIVTIVWAVITKVPTINQNFEALKQPVQRQTTLSADESWHVAGTAIRDYPFLGSGPATFLFDYTRYRSASSNLDDTWTQRFVVAHNQYLQVLATMGVLGLLTYLFFIFRICIYGFRTALTNRDTGLYPLKVALFAGIVAFAAATTTTPTNTPLMLAFFILLAGFMVLERLSGSPAVAERKLAFVLATAGASPEVKPANVIPLLLFIPGVILAGGVLFVTAQYTRANAYYVNGVTALASGKPDSARQGLIALETAVQTNPFEDGYRRDLARTSFNVALAVSQKKDITDNDKKVVSQLLQASIGQARAAAGLSPYNSNNWLTLADIYRRIAGQVKGAGDISLAAYNQAIRTDPANAQLFLDVGGIFYAAGLFDQSIDAFKRAIELKPNLANAHYNLANAYVKKGEFNSAFIQYSAAKQLIENLPASDTTKKTSLETLDKELASIKDKVSTQSGTVAGEETQSTPLPTVTGSPTATVSASPASSATSSPRGRGTSTPSPRPAN